MSNRQARKEIVWDSFSAHLTNMKRLMALQAILDDEQRALKRRIAELRQLLQRATGLNWRQLEQSGYFEPVDGLSARSVRSLRRNLRRDGAVGQTEQDLDGRQMCLSDWVLKAVGHYEDNNPQSKVNPRAIKAWLDAEDPKILAGRNRNAVSAALSTLKRRKLITRKVGRTARDGRWVLTSKGRRELTGTKT